ncbi:MAG: tripartite tricarboxylate transporter substrate-binding protein [Burkholderiales bacterium]
MSYAILGSIGPHLRSGKVFPLARVGTRRYDALPNVPAMSELAPGFEAPPSWTGLFGPANLPSEVLRRIGNDSAKAVHQPAIKAKMAEAGFEVIGNTPD